MADTAERMPSFELAPELEASFDGEQDFDRILALDGTVYRELEGRRTLRFTAAGRNYFIKVHRTETWRTRLHGLLPFRIPLLGAEPEWLAVRRLEALGIETVPIAGCGRRGPAGGRCESFLITRELDRTMSLEDFCRDWARRPPRFDLKRAIIEALARTARRLHENGVHHRDFYACHFLLDLGSIAGAGPRAPRLHVIDLHRAVLSRRLSRRRRRKDLAGLYFSSLDFGLTRTDVFRFVAAYSDRPLREALGGSGAFWRRVARRAARLYRKHHGRPPGR